MLAQLIQALYNIVDSLFVASWAESGLTALSIIYPAQLLMIALERQGERFGVTPADTLIACDPACAPRALAMAAASARPVPS